MSAFSFPMHLYLGDIEMNRRSFGFSVVCAVFAASVFVGCGKSPPPNALPGDSDAHAHAEEGPHHGHLIELGQEEYHAELTHDDVTKTVTIYLLDKSAKGAVAIGDPDITLNLSVDGQPLQAKLQAAPQQGDPPGQSSRFAISNEKVMEAIESPKTQARINVSINGKSYSGVVEHHEHGEHKH